jgi:hypothetical protein
VGNSRNEDADGMSLIELRAKAVTSTLLKEAPVFLTKTPALVGARIYFGDAADKEVRALCNAVTAAGLEVRPSN